MPRPATIRSLAKSLRISVATVSEALRDSPKVKPETKQRVLRAAEAAGYQRNPLLGATFSALRLGRHQGFNGVLALVEVASGRQTELGAFHREVVEGASDTARSLGFRTELFWVGETAPALSVPRLNRVLYARGITGVILLPFDHVQDFSAFDFSRLSAVSMEHRLIKPALHNIQPDHYLSIRSSLGYLTERGYRRIGLCLEAAKDERVDFKWSSGFLSYYRVTGRELAVPPLVVPRLTKAAFQKWRKEHAPDLVISHSQTVVEWLKEEGLAVPKDVGFFRINVTERTAPCAGLDLYPRRLGAVAVETVVSMIHRREEGLPKDPNTISVDALCVDGPTIKALKV